MATIAFYYDDDNQKIAHQLYQFRENKIYSVEQMQIDGITASDNLMQFHVESVVNRKYRRRKTDKFSTLEQFYTDNNILAKKLPHWQRTAVTVKVFLQLPDCSGPRHTLVNFSTWFDNKFNSNAEAIACDLVRPDYAQTAQQIRADWSTKVVTDDTVDKPALVNGIGILTALSNHLERENSRKQKELLAMFN